jgi:acyl-CoA synthetase (NDP forming)
MGGSQKPLFAFISPYAPQLLATFIQQSIPAFAAPEGCARGLRALLQVSEWEDKQVLPSPTLLGPATVEAYAGNLNEYEAKALFCKFGMPMVHEK